MRLIDADALIESLSINLEDCPGCPEPEWLEELADILALAPTVYAIDRQAAIEKFEPWRSMPYEKRTKKRTETHGVCLDTISRASAIDAIHGAIIDFFDVCDDDEESPITYKDELLLEINKAISGRIKQLPSARSGITLESAIDYLHSIGWMQEHDRILTESAQLPTPFCRNCGARIGGLDETDRC